MHRLGPQRHWRHLEAPQHRTQATTHTVLSSIPSRPNSSSPPEAQSLQIPLSGAITGPEPRPAPPQPNPPLEPPSNLQPEIQPPPPVPTSPPQMIPANSLVDAPPPNSPTTAAPQSPSAATTSPSSRIPVRKVTPTNQSALSLKRKIDSPVEKTPASKKHSSPSRPSLSVKPLSPNPTSSPKSPTLLEIQHSFFPSPPPEPRMLGSCLPFRGVGIY